MVRLLRRKNRRRAYVKARATYYYAQKHVQPEGGVLGESGSARVSVHDYAAAHGLLPDRVLPKV